MRKIFIICCLIAFPGYALSQSTETGKTTIRQLHQENDSIIWKIVSEYSHSFNKGDTGFMSKLLPEDFILQWMHENFIGKKNLLKAMVDTAVRRVMQHQIDQNETSLIRYADDQNAACINTNFEFLDPSLLNNIRNQHGYGVCIVYLQKKNSKWLLQTIHFDLHCSLCNL